MRTVPTQNTASVDTRAPVRVMVVDDEFGDRRALADALNDLGWELRSAATGVDALAVLQTWRPAVILLDLLPVMDGWTFREEILRQRALQAIPIVAIWAVAHLEYEAALAKPVELDDLVSTVRRVLWLIANDMSGHMTYDVSSGMFRQPARRAWLRGNPTPYPLQSSLLTRPA